MARARSIKPGFFKNEGLAELGAESMLLFAGLWTLADRSGRLEDRPKRIRAEVFPYWPKANVEKLLSGLHDAGFIIRYQGHTGESYIAIPSWDKHQNPHIREAASSIPAPGEHSAGTVQAGLTPSSLTPDSLNTDSSAAGVPRPPIAFPAAPSWKLDETYLPFVEVWREVAEVTGKPLIDEDFVNAHFRWQRLDFDQKQLAIQHIRERIDKGVWSGSTDPQFIPLPAKYIESAEYKRPVVGLKPIEGRKSRQQEQADAWSRA